MANDSGVVGVLRALLTADHTQFDTGMRKAVATTATTDKAIQALAGNVAKLGPQAERMAKAFGGEKMLASANNLVAAVTKIGGATKLTESEQAKVNRTVTDAIAKYTALGRQAPQAMRDLAEATRAVSGSTGGFSSAIATAGKDVLTMAAGFVTAQAAFAAVRAGLRLLVDEIKTLTIEGAAVADVEENFNRLTAQVGRLGSTLMTVLRDGTHNTVSDFELMKLATQDLAAGLNLTDAQFSILARGAFALAQATGGDVKDALDTMNDAMLTGRTRALALLTGKIDLTAAEERFARSQKIAVANLSEEGKLEAARIAILDGVSAAIVRLGDQTDGLDERVAQTHVLWQNFQSDLGKTIASSPAIEAGMVGIKDALAGAFNADRQQTITGMATAIDDLAVALVGMARIGVQSGGFLAQEFLALYKVFGNLRQIIDGNVLAFEAFGLAIARTLNIATLGKGFNADIARIRGDMQALEASMLARGQSLQAADRAQQSAGETATRLAAALTAVQARMQAATGAATSHTAITNALASAQGAAAQTAQQHAAWTKASTGEMDRATVAAKALRDEAFGLVFVAQANALAAAIGGVAGVATMAIDKQAALNKLMLDAIDAAQRNGQAIPIEWLRIEVATEAALMNTTTGLAAARKGAEDYLTTLGKLPAALDAIRVPDVLASGRAGSGAASTGPAIEDNRASAAIQQRRVDLVKMIDAVKASFGQLEAATIEGLGSLIFGGWATDTREFNRVADDAEQDFLRIERSGKATAEELTLAFRRWREAEERANQGFGERFKNLWQGIKTSIVGVLNDLLGMFTKQFLGGLIGKLGGAKLAGSIASLFTGGATSAAAGAGLSALAGGGAAMGAHSAIAGGGVLAGGAGAGGAGSAIAAFATNPWTIGIAAGIAGFFALKKWFGGGQGKEVKALKTKFQGQFGGESGLVSAVSRVSGEPNGGDLINQYARATNLKNFRAAEQGIATLLAPRRVQMFNLGGFVPPNAVVPAVLHGGTHGEMVVPLGPGIGSTGAGRNVSIAITVQAWDGRDVTRAFREDIIPRIKSALSLNTDDLRGHTQRMLVV